MNGYYGVGLTAFADAQVWFLWVGVALLSAAVVGAIWLAIKCEGK